MKDGGRLQFGSDTYRAGARERRGDAGVLMHAGKHVGALYSAGLAVEGMLRSLIWLRDRSLDERHDLRAIAIRIEQLGLLRAGGRDDDFVATVGSVAKQWHNNLRFADTAHTERWLFENRPIRRHESRRLRAVCYESFNKCSAIVKRCEVVWRRHRKPS